MYSVGDYIVYNGSDVCKVTCIDTLKIRSVHTSEKRYYFLENVFYKDMIYVPVDTKASMRPIISRKEALALIDSLPNIEVNPCPGSDKKRLTDHYTVLMAPCTCEAMARTAKTIFLKYHAAGMRSKLPNSTEATYYKRASDLMLQELAVALVESIEDVQKRMEAVISPHEPMKWTL